MTQPTLYGDPHALDPAQQPRFPGSGSSSMSYLGSTSSQGEVPDVEAGNHLLELASALEDGEDLGGHGKSHRYTHIAPDRPPPIAYRCSSGATYGLPTAQGHDSMTNPPTATTAHTRSADAQLIMAPHAHLRSAATVSTGQIDLPPAQGTVAHASKLTDKSA